MFLSNALLHFRLYRVPEFEASQYLVTNEEFLEFVCDGGYSRPELWTQEGEGACDILLFVSLFKLNSPFSF